MNQHRYVVEEICQFGRPYHYGLEAGSKPELLAVMAMLDQEDGIVICNGYKDEEYVETALLCSKLGRTVIMVVEKPSELELIKQVSAKVGVKPLIGIRAKLATRGSGRWESSGGDRSKFGLSAREMLDAVAQLREFNMLDSLVLRFHLGCRSRRSARSERAAQAGRELPTSWGGLSWDVGHDGSQTPSSSMVSLQEYANDIVFSMMEMCDAESVPHPTIVSESGRAVVAHHAVLVVNVLGVGEFFEGKIPEKLRDDAPQLLKNLWDTHRDVRSKNFLEAYHDAVEYKDECLSLFALGHLTLEDRVAAENLFWAICQKVLRIVRDSDHVPEELEGLEKALADTYFCNFSMFQSVPDSWAVEQLFPIMPIHG